MSHNTQTARDTSRTHTSRRQRGSVNTDTTLTSDNSGCTHEFETGRNLKTRRNKNVIPTFEEVVNRKPKPPKRDANTTRFINRLIRILRKVPADFDQELVVDGQKNVFEMDLDRIRDVLKQGNYKDYKFFIHAHVEDTPDFFQEVVDEMPEKATCPKGSHLTLRIYDFVK